MDKIDLSNAKQIIETARAKDRRRITKKEIVRLLLNDIENMLDEGYTFDDVSLVLSQKNILQADESHIRHAYHYFKRRMLPKKVFFENFANN
jgi:hypothetical protein